MCKASHNGLCWFYLECVDVDTLPMAHRWIFIIIISAESSRVLVSICFSCIGNSTIIGQTYGRYWGGGITNKTTNDGHESRPRTAHVLWRSTSFWHHAPTLTQLSFQFLLFYADNVFIHEIRMFWRSKQVRVNGIFSRFKLLFDKNFSKASFLLWFMLMRQFSVFYLPIQYLNITWITSFNIIFDAKIILKPRRTFLLTKYFFFFFIVLLRHLKLLWLFLLCTKNLTHVNTWIVWCVTYDSASTLFYYVAHSLTSTQIENRKKLNKNVDFHMFWHRR